MADDDKGTSGADGNGGQQQQQQASDKTFTQADVDRIVQERAVREVRSKYADYDDLKSKAARLDELEAKSKTDLEKMSDRAATLERERDDAKLALQEQAVKTALIAEAAKKNAVDPDAVVSLVDRAALEFDKDGAPSNVEQVVTSLLDSKPWLAGRNAAAGSADQGGRGGSTAVKQVTREELSTMSDAEYIKAKSEGRFTSLLSGGK